MPDKEKFLVSTSRSELAAALDVPLKSLTYFLYALRNDEDKYSRYTIPKRNGSFREICAPHKGLKRIQKRLSEVLVDIYPESVSAHGFLRGRSIKSNAQCHLNRKWIINIDLKDFFPSIHFGRVKGVFISWPFNFPEPIARDLANLCCCDGILPQGAPTSPIISNFVCWKLDNQLMRFAKKNKCFYTRYADDITFSTNLKEIPESVGVISDYEFKLSDAFIEIIQSNGFNINVDKTRFSSSYNRQEVTGLIVNSHNVNVPRSYVMQVRAMIHAWEKFGLNKAAEEHWKSFNYKN